MTKEDVEDASGEGEQECWFGEGGCPYRARWRVGEIAVRVAQIRPPPFMDKPGSKLD